MIETRKLVLFFLFLFSVGYVTAQTLAEQLGYKKTDRILIINNDDAGMCHAANIGTMEGMKNGLISSATIMPPCPWFNEIAEFAKNNPQYSFGVHLTLTAEWKKYRWPTIAPRCEVPRLYDEQGYMWAGVEEVYQSSDTAEALIEGRAQIKKVLAAGIPVTHIDSHMGTYQYDSNYTKVYVQLAEEFNLPLRMAAQTTLDRMGFSGFRELCRKKGLITPDYFIHEEFKDYKTENVAQFWTNYIRQIKPGVTEIYVHAAAESDEIRNLTHFAQTRINELAFFTSDAAKKLIQEEGVIIIGYRKLFELQRKLKK